MKKSTFFYQGGIFISRQKKLLLFFIINASLALAAIALVIVAKITSENALSELTDCPAHKLFGLYCPFCGGTRAIGSLLKGDVLASLTYNPAILPGIVAFIGYDIVVFKNIITNKSPIIHIHKPVWISLVVILLINWIVRNMLLLVWNIDYISMMSF